MAKLSKLELQVMEALWTLGRASVREIQETFAGQVRPAYTTVQTMVYRLEGKKAVRRVKKIGNAHVFEAMVTRASARRRLVDDLLAFFGGSSQPLMAQLVEDGHITLDDVKEAERLIKKQQAEKP
jgi:BlaI family transcriptional regulator, penicillinase repressor